MKILIQLPLDHHQVLLKQVVGSQLSALEVPLIAIANLVCHRPGKKLRLNAKNSAKRYTWEAIIDRLLLPYLIEMNVDVPLSQLAESKLKQLAQRLSKKSAQQ